MFGPVAWPVKMAPNCSPATQMTMAATAAKAVVNAINVSGT